MYVWKNTFGEQICKQYFTLRTQIEFFRKFYVQGIKNNFRMSKSVVKNSKGNISIIIY